MSHLTGPKAVRPACSGSVSPHTSSTTYAVTQNGGGPQHRGEPVRDAVHARRPELFARRHRSTPLGARSDTGRRRRQKRQRIEPGVSSAVPTAVARRGLTSYTNHGGGPRVGALNGAVMPVPDSSGCAGQPLSAHRAATSATTVASVTRRASPETATSKPCVATLIVQRGSRSMFFALCVRAPVWNQYEPACHIAPTLVACGLPSAFTVVSQNVARFGERGSSCTERSASCASTWDHSRAGSPSASPRLVASMVLRLRPSPKTHRRPGQLRARVLCGGGVRPQDGAHAGGRRRVPGGRARRQTAGRCPHLGRAHALGHR